MDGEVPNEMIAALDRAALAVYSGAVFIWRWLEHMFLLPGEYTVAALVDLARELTGDTRLDLAGYEETCAVVFSIIVWLAVVLLMRSIFRIIGRAASDAWYSAMRAATWLSRLPRIALLKMTAPVRALRRRRPASGTSYSEEFRINTLQMAVMNAQRTLAPGHVATAVDIAGDLGIRPGPVERALEELRKLHLVQVAFGTADGYTGYSLTRPGELFLSTCDGRKQQRPAV